MEIDSTIINRIWLDALTVLATGAVSWWLARNIGLNKVMRERDEKIAKLETKFAVLVETVTPISGAIQKLFIDKLTHFHSPDTDLLLVKLERDALTPDEELDLIQKLEHRILHPDPEIDESERNAARMLIILMRQAKIEMVVHESELRLQLVTIPRHHEEHRENDGG